MPSDFKIQTLDNYRLLMEEVKNRFSVFNLLLSGRTQLPNPAVQEFGFLELRMLCELIALGCLTAHGDLPETQQKRIREEWNATDILNRLERLHADFYPQPIKVSEVQNQNNIRNLEVVSGDAITKAELIRLYGRCADLVHRGSISSLFAPEPNGPMTIPNY